MNIPNETLEIWEAFVRIIREEKIYQDGFKEGFEAIYDGFQYDYDCEYHDDIELRYKVRSTYDC